MKLAIPAEQPQGHHSDATFKPWHPGVGERWSVASLCQAWEVVLDELRDPSLSDAAVGGLARQAEQIVLALACTPHASKLDLVLKLEVYIRAVRVVPSSACEVLRASAMPGGAHTLPSSIDAKPVMQDATPPPT